MRISDEKISLLDNRTKKSFGKLGEVKDRLSFAHFHLSTRGVPHIIAAVPDHKINYSVSYFHSLRAYKIFWPYMGKGTQYKVVLKNPKEVAAFIRMPCDERFRKFSNQILNGSD